LLGGEGFPDGLVPRRIGRALGKLRQGANGHEGKAPFGRP
jgi:hypothetical protein